MKKCANCSKKDKAYKGRTQGSKWFCSAKCKSFYLDNHIPTLKKQIQILFNKMVTDNHPCAWCGNAYEKMDCSHILSRGSNDHLRFDIFNVLPMCSRCHRWRWHDSPLEAIDWFKKKYPARYEYLQFARTQYKGWTAKELKTIRKAIKERDAAKLIRFKDEYQNRL